VVLVRWMAVAGGMALLVSYALLRDHGRAIAATACILVASAPQYFRLVTQTVGSDVPFFLASVSTLLLASRLSTCDVPWRRAWLSTLCALALLSAVLLRSVGIALVGGLSWWLVLSWWRRPDHRWDLVRRFALPLGAGITAQAAWMVWTRAMRIASSAGSDAGYAGHLWLKDAHRRDLGVASVGDIATRIADNAIRYSAILAETLLRRDWIAPVWFSPAVVVPAVLVALGLGVRVWRRGTFAEWYFLAYVAIYLLWPYNEGFRFVVPVLPLAFAYLFEGGLWATKFVRGHAPASGWGLTVVLLGLAAASAASVVYAAPSSRQVQATAMIWFGAGAAVGLLTWRAARGDADRRRPRRRPSRARASRAGPPAGPSGCSPSSASPRRALSGARTCHPIP
jgi:hypothetical protein